MAHHDPALRAALVQARDMVAQHEYRKHRPVEEPADRGPNDPRILKLSIPGSVSATTYLAYVPMFAGEILAVWANTTEVVSSDCIFDLLINSVSVYVETPKPFIPTGLWLSSASVPDTISWQATSRLQIQVIATGGAADMVVSIMFEMG